MSWRSFRTDRLEYALRALRLMCTSSGTVTDTRSMTVTQSFSLTYKSNFFARPLCTEVRTRCSSVLFYALGGGEVLQ